MKKQKLLAHALLATGLNTLASIALAAPDFQMPVTCGQAWEGNTRSYHSPQLAVDLNRYPEDYGAPILASAAGTVSRVANLGNTSYGRYIMIDHGNGWSTVYAHLSAQSVQQGQRVSQGQRIGSLGNTGGSSGAHLHFEQRQWGTPVHIRWNGSQIAYYGTRQYTSRNCDTGSSSGGGSAATGTVRTSGVPLTIRSGAGTGFSAVGSVANGTKVTIHCQKQGEAISGPFGTSALWDRIGSGQYVSDAYVYTGSDGRVAPACQ